MARLGRGLPARVLPFAVNEVTQAGLEFLASAFAYGAARMLILVPPGKATELDALAGQIGLMETVLSGLGFGSGRIDVLQEQDPAAIEAVRNIGRISRRVCRSVFERRFSVDRMASDYVDTYYSLVNPGQPDLLVTGAA